jgi:hypothetical protein
MDVAERAGTGAGGVDASRDEAAGSTDDDLWNRLEREKLARDPRAGTYERLLGRHGPMIGGVAEPFADLLDAMRDRAPSVSTPRASSGPSLLRQIINREPGRTWSPTARIRVRARNVLRRWAAAQTDPRLVWVDPYAPIGNLAMIAAVFGELWCRNAEPNAIVELPNDDLDALWELWFQPFVGTGQGDGWLDHIDLDDEAARARLHGDVAKNITVLCWLAIRPGRHQRQRIVAWQPYLRSAFEKGLIDVDDDSADYLSAVLDRQVSADEITRDIFDALEFIDDDLWCERTGAELGLTQLILEATQTRQQISVRVRVRGVDNPLYDPRVPSLIVAVGKYRSTDAVAAFGLERDWRVVTSPGEPIAYKASLDAPMIESLPIKDDDIANLASRHGVLADLFASDALVA